MANKDVQVRGENKTPSTGGGLPDINGLMERFFSDPFGALANELPIGSRKMMSDVKETDDAYILCAEVPGIPKEDIDINVNGNVLTVRAEHKEENEDEDQGYRREYRSFHQSFSLPSSIDADKIEANCENGYLEILLPKTENAKPKRVEVKSGKGGFLNRLMGKKEESKNQESKKH